MSGLSFCQVCQSLGTGVCTNNETCVCHAGYLGAACQELVTTTLSPVLQVGTIIAGVLGGVLLTLIVGLIIFFIWKRRAKKKSLRFSGSTSTEATIPPMELVVVPALYDLSLSRQNSYETSTETVNYHLYDELP